MPLTPPRDRDTSTRRRPTTVLCALDFTEAADLALTQAWLITAQQPDAELHLVHVADAASKVASTKERLQEREDQIDQVPPRLLAHASTVAWSKGLPELARSVGVHVRFGDPAKAILQLAADLDADLLVVGSDGKKGLRHHVGSVSRRLVEAGQLTVLVSRPKSLEAMRSHERLEPPCPDCVDARAASRGERFFCERHTGDEPHWNARGFSATRRVAVAKPSADSQAAYAP